MNTTSPTYHPLLRLPDATRGANGKCQSPSTTTAVPTGSSATDKSTYGEADVVLSDWLWTVEEAEMRKDALKLDTARQYNFIQHIVGMVAVVVVGLAVALALWNLDTISAPTDYPGADSGPALVQPAPPAVDQVNPTPPPAPPVAPPVISASVGGQR